MKLEAIQAAEAKLLLPTYERNPILFVEGSGMYLIDGNDDLKGLIGSRVLRFDDTAAEAVGRAASALSRRGQRNSTMSVTTPSGEGWRAPVTISFRCAPRLGAREE